MRINVLTLVEAIENDAAAEWTYSQWNSALDALLAGHGKELLIEKRRRLLAAWLAASRIESDRMVTIAFDIANTYPEFVVERSNWTLEALRHARDSKDAKALRMRLAWDRSRLRMGDNQEIVDQETRSYETAGCGPSF